MISILKRKKKADAPADTRKAAPAADAPIKKEARQRKTPSWLVDVRYGRSISVEFFRRNAWLLLVLMVVIISLIGLRYKTKTHMLEIKQLEKELAQTRSEKLREKAQYMSLIRETEMLRLVHEKGLGLEFQEQPPYEVSPHTSSEQ